MKKILSVIVFAAMAYAAICQQTDKIEVFIKGYNINDTIMLGDFLKLTELSVSKSDCAIEKFTMTFLDSGYEVSLVSESNKITEEMKKKLLERKDTESEFIFLYFEKITVKASGKAPVNVSPLIYKLKVR